MNEIPYAKQEITEKDILCVASAIQSYQLTRGEEVRLFEEELAAQVDARFAVVFNSGTSALSAAYFAGEITPFDHLFVTPNTFVGTVAGACQTSKKLHLIDIEGPSGNIDLALLEASINKPTSRGKEWIVPVHFAGVAVDMKRLSKSIKRASTIVLEDAAHAIGSLYPSGEKVGSCTYSDMTIFSFHPAKQITTGEGGAVTTNSRELYERLKLFRNNGIVPSLEMPWDYRVEALTGNFHMNEMQAALGRSQLGRLCEIVQRRRELVQLYRKKMPESLPFVSSEKDSITSYHLAVVHHGERDRIKRELEESGIKTQVHYVPLSRHPALSFAEGECPKMEAYYKTVLSLPLFSTLREEQIERIVSYFS